jgi:hypothetical protein
VISLRSKIYIFRTKYSKAPSEKVIQIRRVNITNTSIGSTLRDCQSVIPITISATVNRRKKRQIERKKEKSSPSESAGGSARKPKYTKLSGESMSRAISKRASEKYHENEKLYMIKKNLFTMMKETKHMYESVEEGNDVPEWCQEKLAVAASMIDTVFEYLGFEKELSGGKHFHHDHESDEEKENCDECWDS